MKASYESYIGTLKSEKDKKPTERSGYQVRVWFIFRCHLFLLLFIIVLGVGNLSKLDSGHLMKLECNYICHIKELITE